MKKGKLLIISLIILGILGGTTSTVLAVPEISLEQQENPDWNNVWEKQCQPIDKGAITWAICNLRERVKALENWKAWVDQKLEVIQKEIADLVKKITDEVARLDARIDAVIAMIANLEIWRVGIDSWKATMEERIQLRDVATGEIYCIWIQYGQLMKGSCENITLPPIEPPEVPQEPETPLPETPLPETPPSEPTTPPESSEISPPNSI